MSGASAVVWCCGPTVLVRGSVSRAAGASHLLVTQPQRPLTPYEAARARERRAAVLAPKAAENKGGRPETGSKLDPVSEAERSARKTRKVAAVGTCLLKKDGIDHECLEYTHATFFKVSKRCWQ